MCRVLFSKKLCVRVSVSCRIRVTYRCPCFLSSSHWRMSNKFSLNQMEPSVPPPPNQKKPVLFGYKLWHDREYISAGVVIRNIRSKHLCALPDWTNPVKGLCQFTAILKILHASTKALKLISTWMLWAWPLTWLSCPVDWSQPKHSPPGGGGIRDLSQIMWESNFMREFNSFIFCSSWLDKWLFSLISYSSIRSSWGWISSNWILSMGMVSPVYWIVGRYIVALLYSNFCIHETQDYPCILAFSLLLLVVSGWSMKYNLQLTHIISAPPPLSVIIGILDLAIGCIPPPPPQFLM